MESRPQNPEFRINPENFHQRVCRSSLASGDSFEIGDGRILIYSSIGVQKSIF